MYKTNYLCPSLILNMENLALNIESLIFAASNPISFNDIKSTLEAHMETKLKNEPIEEAIEALIKKYQDEAFAIEIVEISNGFTFMSKGAHHNLIGTYLKQITNKKLSKSALETLSIIAYKQPTTKAEMESIRGVNCDYSVTKLLEKELVEIKGRSEGIGKPLLYGTSDKFMDYFGLKNMDDMPKLKDFELPDNSIGLPDSAEVTIAVADQEEE